ncbi:hypothetical protein [Erythrobacter sp. THAF29]|uniref:hypothetical protein n=1 Tax=Erythrobacter sp. THAF29 TaxID=2587851 RepID=UPI001267CBDC|nr:hypothetical protein [Erythrobacter sp. THAF29]QFT78519.1 hypothetical protein FIU90_13295 [Erythrobacter sp. THAF29]
MRQATFLALCFALLAAAWQCVLWSALPNVGMGGLAIIYFVWPMLVAWSIGLWCLLRAAGKGAMSVFVASCAAMILVTTMLHPQDSSLGIKAKIEAILSM